jgi:hypothetical protein
LTRPPLQGPPSQAPVSGRHMAAAIEVGMDLSLVADREGPAGLAQVNDIKRHCETAVGQVGRSAQVDGWIDLCHAFASNQACSCATDAATNKGSSAAKPSGGWAP